MEKFVINIGRQLGSGGRQIGSQLAKKLGIAYFDKELIQIAAKESGLGKEFFERADEKGTYSLFGGFLNLGHSLENFQNSNYLYNESLFKIQSDVIKELANKQSSLFVGRCADYVLRNSPRVLNVFITADMDSRINRVVRTYELTSEDKARDFILKTDKKRANYYNYYTNKQWGVASSYHLCIDSSLLGSEKTVEFIANFAEDLFEI